MNIKSNMFHVVGILVISQAFAEPSALAVEHTKQSGADLYYFSPDEAQKSLQAFGNKQKSSGYTFTSDVPSEIQTQMREDLAFIAGIRGANASPLHKQIFGHVDGRTYMDFFNSRVTEIGMDDCGDSHAVACVIPYSDPSKMWLTENFVKFKHPQISRMMVVFHESRHTESQNGNWPHAYCPTPFQDSKGKNMKSIWTGALLEGEPACDETVFGSYGTSSIMLKNIQKFCSNCTEKVKMDAGLYADDQAGRITDPDARAQLQNDFYL